MSNKMTPIFSKPVIEIVKQRRSWRTYLTTPLSDDIINKILNFAAENAVGPFGTQTRTKIITIAEKNREEKKQLGTYGFISGAPHFISVIPRNEGFDRSIEDCGYVFEKIILSATDLGLGTCWLAGSFNKSGFHQSFNIEDDENLPAISPIGLVPKSEGFPGNLIRTVVGAKHRKAWNSLFFENDFTTPLTLESASSYSDCFEMVRLGPSASNAQPWRLIKDTKSEMIHFYIEKRKGDTEDSHIPSYNRLDTGIAMCHFELVAVELGLKGKWVVQAPEIQIPNPRIVYMLSWKME
jgi:hypothetical protein